MSIMLAFAPFIVFAIANPHLGTLGALIAAALVSAGLLVRDRLRAAEPKILEIGTCMLFVALAAYVGLADGTLSLIATKLWVDLGLLAIVLVSMIVGRPFTIQYARESVPAAYWNTPAFRRTNYIITTGWAVAFLVIVLAEIALLYVPAMPHAVGVVVMIAALVAAVKFTGWYTKVARA